MPLDETTLLKRFDSARVITLLGKISDLLVCILRQLSYVTKVCPS